MPNSPRPHFESNSPLRGRTLWLARGVWLVAVLSMLGTFVFFVPTHLQSLNNQCQENATALINLGIPVSLCSNWLTVFSMLSWFVFIVGSIVMFVIKPDDWMAIYASFQILVLGTIFSQANVYVVLPTEWILIINLARAASSALAYVFLYIFPDGRFVPRWTRWIALLAALYAFSWVVFPDAPTNAFDLENWPLAYFFAIGWIGIGFLIQVYRYNQVSDWMQRQQAKWVVYGVGILLTGFVTIYFPGVLVPVLREPGTSRAIFLLVRDPLFQVAMLLELYCIFVAIVRFHLWDIDIILRRTMIYGALTVSLILIYLTSVVVMLGLLGPIAGSLLGNISDATTSSLIPAFATLAIAALFNPLRQRIQNGIDRRFYRSKYDAQLVLARFAAKLRDQVELDTLSRELLQVVDETMQPTDVSLWIKK
ncbi:MAG: hypothetical protein HZB51_01340 [Chloroflexi bacterium]|nr:hypothetical protein [Chloroflexota bacterium]